MRGVYFDIATLISDYRPLGRQDHLNPVPFQ
jgi:hypothetical protein